MNNTNVTLVGTGGVLIGAGVSHLFDTTYPWWYTLGLVTYGVILIIVVAILQKKGYDVRGGDQG